MNLGDVLPESPKTRTLDNLRNGWLNRRMEGRVLTDDNVIVAVGYIRDRHSNGARGNGEARRKGVLYEQTVITAGAAIIWSACEL